MWTGPCSEKEEDGHEINIVGYGTTDDNTDYWVRYYLLHASIISNIKYGLSYQIIRNSWNTDWGEKGYVGSTYLTINCIFK